MVSRSAVVIGQQERRVYHRTVADVFCSPTVYYIRHAEETETRRIGLDRTVLPHDYYLVWNCAGEMKCPACVCVCVCLFSQWNDETEKWLGSR